MTKIEESELIDVPAEKIWNFVTDPDNFSKYILGYIEGNFLSENRTGLGSEFEWYTKFWGRRFRSVEKVTEWVENQKVAYHGTLSGAEFWSQMLMIKKDFNAEFKVIIEYKMPYSIFGKLLDVIYFRRRIRKEVKYSLNKVKEQFNAENHEKNVI